ncbi:MAG: hypothetical protein AAB472_00130 [Patescibacteria group bacterium]
MSSTTLNQFLLRTCVGLISIVFIGVLSFPRTTRAFIVYDPANHVVNSLSAVQNTTLNVKEFALDPLAYIVSKVALQSVTKSVVNWINSGFKGSPAFITDLDTRLLKVGDTVANDFLNQLETNTAITSPFQDVLTAALRRDYFISTTRDGFFLQNPYTLNQVSNDPNALYEGRFVEGGGWDAFFSAIANPANNPFGADLLQRDALKQQIANQVDTEKTKLSWGNGFLSWQGDCASSNTSTTVNQAGGILNFNGTPTTPTSPVVLTPSVKLSGTVPCLHQNIVTPGAIIHDQLTKTLGSSVDQLTSSDELNEIVGALIGQLVSNVVGGTGLGGLSQPSSGGGRSFIDQAADSTQYSNASANSNLSTNFVTTLGQQKVQLQAYQTNWTKIADAANSAKTAIQNSSCAQNSPNASQVQTIITQGTTAIANAGAAINTIDQIIADLGASGGSAKTQTSAVATASAAYQTLLGSNSMPSISDITYAQEQSVATDSETTPSLFTKMLTVAASPCI